MLGSAKAAPRCRRAHGVGRDSPRSLGAEMIPLRPPERDQAGIAISPARYFLHELGRVEVRKVVSTDIFDRNDGLATILRHQEESSVHCADPKCRVPASDASGQSCMPMALHSDELGAQHQNDQIEFGEDSLRALAAVGGHSAQRGRSA